MKPIVYEHSVIVRFADLDPYGHVNSSLYLDYLISSRFLYALKELKTDPASIVEKGLGFYLAHAEMRFLRPLVGLGEVWCRSWVESLDGTTLIVPYELGRSTKPCSKGVLKFAIVDLATNRPTDCPEWAEALFWEK